MLKIIVTEIKAKFPEAHEACSLLRRFVQK